jgi:thiol-disulfide isomerase/thioredoxin
MRQLGVTLKRLTAALVCALALNAQDISLNAHPANPSYAPAPEAAIDQVGAAAEFAARQSALVLGPRDEDLVEIAKRCLDRAREIDPQNPVWIAAYVRFQRARAAATHDSQEKLAALKEAAKLAELPFSESPDELRISVLPDLAAAELEAGDLESAGRHARSVLQLAAAEPEAWNHDDLVHAADTVLGRVALQRGDVEEAKARLLASGKIEGSGVLGSFGPSMALAQELLAAGERDVVRQYLELCRSFWKHDRGRIDRYLELIQDPELIGSDATPNLLAPYALQAPSLDGAAAPSFRLRDIAGREWTLPQLSGKTVMIEFWTTWCPKCREELPVLEKLANEFHDRELVTLAVDVGEDAAVVRKFVEEYGVKLPVLLGGEDAMILAYRVEAYPTLVVIDPLGKVAQVHTGARSDLELRELLSEETAARP